MPIPGLDPYDFKNLFYKFALLVGILIIIYSLLWMFTVLNIIPIILLTIFPQILLLLIGIFIVIMVLSKKNTY